MLYDLIEVRRGKETVVMTDQKTKVNDRMKTLRKSKYKIKGDKITYFIRESDTNEKFKKKPIKYYYEGDQRSGPKRIK